MRKICIVLPCLLVSLAAMAKPAASPEHAGMKKHLRTARHAVAQPAVNPPKEVDKKTAQTK
ncbi:hypothetical protein SAMN05192566_0593 [Methylophilus rhizosphaerae]|uniref:Uncharacterized protein n=1 Tax=Methylophilus rhizosphaerae TaxID=492660 RepID=A0A1G8ZYE6_9PROT|nr:hypothetical protein [Methylophilus rhizosphaerae]SDK20159.1 hypothetical protein SAMN05192566_0593 [Methylophilus rhizosphaerae]